MRTDLPARPGSRPRTTRATPHSQLDQQPSDRRFADTLIDRFLALRPRARETASGISVPGARALVLAEVDKLGPPAAFLVGREFAHVHPTPDASLHLALPVELARAAQDLGWAEPHLLAGTGNVPETVVMVYAPRDEDEADVVLDLLLASHAFATATTTATATNAGGTMQVNHITDDVDVLADCAQVPGIGALAINAFLVRASEPLLVDTGMGTSRGLFRETLSELIDLDDLRWIYLTHPDRDHTGSLLDLLEAAPHARLITTFTAVGYLSTEFEIPLPRVRLLNVGESMPVGDRTITAFRPPLFDSPMTVGFRDDTTGSCFVSDCFGAPLADPDLAQCADVAAVPAPDLAAAQLLWGSIDAPWAQLLEVTRLRNELDGMRELSPSWLFSTHLPPARGSVLGSFIETLAQLPQWPAFVGPDQVALEQMLAQLAGATEPGVALVGST